MKRWVIFFLFMLPLKSDAVVISSKTYNYIWNPFTGTQQYVTSIDTTSIRGSGVTISTTAAGVLITALPNPTPTPTPAIPCGNSGDVQINFNGACGGIGGGTTGSISGPLNSLSVNNGVTLSFSTGTLNPQDVSVFASTMNAITLAGFKLFASSGPIAANTSLTVSFPGTSNLWFPMVSELEGVNTAACSIRIKSTAVNSYVIYNSDVLNAKNYVTTVFGK